jgi:hypothetical protein
VPAPGSSAETKCSPGTYQPSTGQSSCLSADVGNDVAATGASAETQCSAGTYQPSTGQSSCLSADVGNYVSGTGATGETKCAPGKYQPHTGQVACILADIGSFVSTAGEANEVACPAGETTLTTGGTACLATPASVCALTVQYADGSARYLAMTASQRTAFNKTVNAFCAADLRPIKPGISAFQKAVLIGLYKFGVNLFVAEGWLTRAQATQLASLTASL